MLIENIGIQDHGKTPWWRSIFNSIAMGHENKRPVTLVTGLCRMMVRREGLEPSHPWDTNT